MANDKNPFDDLPKRDLRHVIEEKAETAFQSRLTANGRFILQRAERKDYGIDCQIEVIRGDQATNARVHVQLKGTERGLNADGSLSVEVSRTNLNYLLMHPHSAYVAHHVPTDNLLATPAADTTSRPDLGSAGSSISYRSTSVIGFTASTGLRTSARRTLPTFPRQAADDKQHQWVPDRNGSFLSEETRGVGRNQG